jgi:integral membrane protein
MEVRRQVILDFHLPSPDFRLPTSNFKNILMIQKMLLTPIGRLRIIGFLEGISFLILLGIAMPMKYFMGMPMAVKFTGWAHGLLFILFLYALLQVTIEMKWSLKKVFTAFIASLIPFGTFVLDVQLRKMEAGS